MPHLLVFLVSSPSLVSCPFPSFPFSCPFPSPPLTMQFLFDFVRFSMVLIQGETKKSPWFIWFKDIVLSAFHAPTDGLLCCWFRSFLKNLSEITSVKEQSSSRIHIKRINQSHLATRKGAFLCGTNHMFSTRTESRQWSAVIGGFQVLTLWVKAASSAVRHYSGWSVISLNVIGGFRSILVF